MKINKEELYLYQQSNTLTKKKKTIKYTIHKIKVENNIPDLKFLISTRLVFNSWETYSQNHGKEKQRSKSMHHLSIKEESIQTWGWTSPMCCL